MWDLIVSGPDHCLSFDFTFMHARLLGPSTRYKRMRCDT